MTMTAPRKYGMLRKDASPEEIKALVDAYNDHGDQGELFSAWEAVNAAALKVINKRLGSLRVKDRQGLADEVSLMFFERIVSRRANKKKGPYVFQRFYAVLWGLSTWVMYRDQQRQYDREHPDEKL